MRTIDDGAASVDNVYSALCSRIGAVGGRWTLRVRSQNDGHFMMSFSHVTFLKATSCDQLGNICTGHGGACGVEC